ncbi:MAG: family 1 glycosylhydrolase, partial [Desulfobacterales bacterium]|nr:family 1 glycosylhydrolase [Desulfobacterales bacterium]
KLIDELLDNGIDPYITLFHWDYPYELFCKGGLLNNDSSKWFAEYTKIIVDKLSDRVKNWMTINEPECFVGLGHQIGNHAPGLKLNEPEVMRAWHNMLLCHGEAVRTIRQNSKQECNIGCAPCGHFFYPATEDKKDIETARRKTFENKDIWALSMWLDPICFGKYPDDAYENIGVNMPEINDGDMEIISQPIDFIGCNLYQGVPIKTDENGNPVNVEFPVGEQLTAYSWHVTPQALRWASDFLYERYNKPLFITENGLSNIDWKSPDGKVHDPQRIDFLNRYLVELKKAIDDGVDVRGYFAWSFMDNFEWAEGYKHRFGLVHVDYDTLERTVKDSGYWYKKVIETNGGSIGGME